MSEIHPVRYATAMSARLSRLEALYTAIAMPSGGLVLPPPETAGLNHSEFRWLHQRAEDLEALIADWHVDGRRVAYVSGSAVRDSEPAEMIYLDDVPPGVCFFKFEAADDLPVDGSPGARLDGFYAREVAQQGSIGVEVTVVCDEPAWSDMGRLSFEQTLKVCARVAVGHVPFWTPLPPALASKMFSGDRDVVSASILPGALGLIANGIQKFGRPKPRHLVPSRLLQR